MSLPIVLVKMAPPCLSLVFKAHLMHRLPGWHMLHSYSFNQVQNELKSSKSRAGRSPQVPGQQERAYHQALSDIQQAQENLQHFRKSSDGPSTPLEDIRLERDELQTRVGSLRSMLASLEEQLRSLAAALTGALSEKQQGEAVISELEAQLSVGRQRSSHLEAQLQETRAERAALQAEIHSFRTQVYCEDTLVV